MEKWGQGVISTAWVCEGQRYDNYVSQTNDEKPRYCDLLKFNKTL